MAFVPPPISFGTLMHNNGSITSSSDQVSVLLLLIPTMTVVIGLIFSIWFVRKVNRTVKKSEEAFSEHEKRMRK